MKRALIIEASPSGHRLFYVRILVDAARALGVQPVVSLGPGVVDSPEFRLHLQPVTTEMILHSHGAAINAKKMQSISLQFHCDYIIIPDADPYLTRLVWPRLDCDFRILLMRDPADEVDVSAGRRAKLIAKKLLLLALRKRKRVRLFTLRPPGYVGESKECFVNDPIEARIDNGDFERFVKRYEMTSERYWFGMAGVISLRKHPEMVLSALADLPPDRVGLLLAGPNEEDATAALQLGTESLRNRGIPVVRVNRSLSNSELNAAVKAMDCVVIAYETHAPPSTLGKSLALGTQCIVAGSATLRGHAQLIAHGFTSSLDIDSIRAAMISALNDGTRPQPRARPSTDVFAEVLLGEVGQGAESQRTRHRRSGH